MDKCSPLQISKDGRKVHVFFRSITKCFGANNYDLVRVDAVGKYPNITFEQNEYYIPIFQATGRVVGRQLTEIECEVFRQRPKWLDKKESTGIIRLESLIKEDTITMNSKEQIKLKCEKETPKGSLIVHLHFSQFRPTM